MGVKLGILVAGGSNRLEHIVNAIESGELDAQIALVVSSHADSRDLKIAEEHGLPTMSLGEEVYADPETADLVIASQMMRVGAEWLVMVGYDKDVYAPLATAYEDRILDIHPSLLPSFPDEDAVAEAYISGVKITGATVVIVNPLYPAPPIVAQEALRIENGWALPDLECVMSALEDMLYLDVLKALAAGRVEMDGRRRVNITRE